MNETESETDSAGILSDDPEEWADWETRLVKWSAGCAIIAISILGWLINSYLLP
ncbi:MAG: hypothetical protein OEY07_06720 [Gammaproteobacteria bacterium]|nr:hypothetical protein [Gammaproteobacteria bacterium]